MMIRWIEKHISVFFNLNGILWLTYTFLQAWQTASDVIGYFASASTTEQLLNQQLLAHEIFYGVVSFLVSLVCFKRVYFAFPFALLALVGLPSTLYFLYFQSALLQTIDLNGLFESLTQGVYLRSYLSAYLYVLLLSLSVIGVVLLMRIWFMQNNRFYKR